VSPVKPGYTRPLDLRHGRIDMSHGSGGRSMVQLIEQIFLSAFDNPALAARDDHAVLATPPELALGGQLVMATDSHVVSPLFFPGGDIGRLAVHGTINDLAMCGARPLALSCALVLEEGLPLATRERVVDSIAAAARDAGVPVATGDTKVVERGKGDGLFVTTSGVGLVVDGVVLRPDRVRPGDAILVSGSIGRHGAAVLSVREGIAFESDLVSDSAWLGPLVAALLAAAPDAHCLRDPTRGGVGAVLHEIARGAGLEVEIDDGAIPVDAPVRAACELLGLDPLFLACEGRCIAFVAERDADRALAVLRAQPLGRDAARIGRVLDGPARVCVRTRMGGRRLLVLPAGDPLPRIC